MADNDSKSKKPSDASSKPQPPSPLVLFIDRSLGKREIATALRHQADVEVHIHDDYFPPDAKDEDWLSEVGQREWIVLTKDSRIRYRITELTALRRAGVRAFVLVAGNLRGDEMADTFVKALPAIRWFTAKNPPPFIARITKSGSVDLVWPPKKSSKS